MGPFCITAKHWVTLPIVTAIGKRGYAVRDRVYIAHFDRIAIYFILSSHGDR
jgi:hypothetical protein